MAGKHSQKSSSNTSLIVLIIIAVVVVAAIVAGVIFLMNGGISLFSHQEETTAPAAEATTAAATALPPSTQAETQPPTTAPAAETTAAAPETHAEETGVPADDTPVDIVVPTDAGMEVSYFNGSFIPNGKVEDTVTGGEATLREVFGSGYANGVLTFNSDGTFTDTLVSDGANRGAYVVQEHTIHATYTNDRNMRIEVTEWDGDTPVAFHITYNDYVVYFG